ncbi:MAG: acyl carrier protein [Ilumatobacteraceae bacterium]
MTDPTTTPPIDRTSMFADRLVRFIADEVATAPDPIEVGTDLVMTGLVDSLGVVLIVEWIERQLGIRIDPADVVIEHFESVAAMVAYLSRRDDCSVA